ncbi:MAG: hypothetical protein ABIR29_09610, partial [Chthoniobacterales bacterium]
NLKISSASSAVNFCRLNDRQQKKLPAQDGGAGRMQLLLEHAPVAAAEVSVELKAGFGNKPK